MFHLDRDKILSFLRALISCALIADFLHRLNFLLIFFFFSTGVMSTQSRAVHALPKKANTERELLTNCYFELLYHPYTPLDKAFDLLCILHFTTHSRCCHYHTHAHTHVVQMLSMYQMYTHIIAFVLKTHFCK